MAQARTNRDVHRFRLGTQSARTPSSKDVWPVSEGNLVSWSLDRRGDATEVESEVEPERMVGIEKKVD